MVMNKEEILVNRYDPETSTVYQFHGCKWHRCPWLKMNDEEKCKEETLNLENRIGSSGMYNVVLVWECENPELSKKCLQQEFVPYPHYIVYDFEAILEKRDLSLTLDLTIDCFHIPISVAINES